MNKEDIFLLKNYALTLENKEVLSRNYKLIIKDIGCNAACPFCDDWKNKGRKEKIIQNLYKKIQEILTEEIKFKSIEILWWEPLLIFQDICNIVSLCTKSWILISFPSNASLLTKEKIDILMAKWLKHFNFSLDFPSEKHEQLRKLPGTYKNIIDFSQYIQSKKWSVKWNTVIGKFNLNDIVEFRSLYKKWIIPNKHNFIAIEKNNDFSQENILNNDSKIYVQNILQEFRSEFPILEIIENWFDIRKQNSSLEKCFLPIIMRTYYIKEDSISVSPCHFDSKKWVKDISAFTLKAIKEWCNLCDSSCKTEINQRMKNIRRIYETRKK